jgi:hypothetical protein
MAKRSAILYTAPIDSPFILSNEAERLYRKQLIYEGEFVTPKGQRIKVDRSLIDHWAKSHKELIAAGFTPPLPLEHTTDPEKNRGQVLAMEVGADEKGRYSLFGTVKFSDAEAEKLAARTNVSVYAPPEFKYAGRKWSSPITHVALTNYPVVPSLGNFQTIAASLQGEIKMAFDWTPIQELLDLPEGTELTDETAVTVLTMAIDALKKAAGEKPAEKKPDETPAPDKKPDPVPLSASFVGILRDNRRMKLDALQQAGKLTKAARDKLEKQYLGDEALSLSLSSQTGGDGFDQMVEVLSANDRCVPLIEKTGRQVVVLSNNGAGGGEESPLVKDAKRRAEEAKKKRRR